MEKKYEVKIKLTNADGGKYDYEATVEFAKKANDYGNGYHMGIESKDEPFGFGAYDIRYDTDFNPDKVIEWLTAFYCRRFTGTLGAWGIQSIKISVK